MKKWVITCDKCGKEIEGHPARMEVHETERDEVFPIKTLYQPDEDYCVDCVTELIALIDNFKPQKPAEGKVEKNTKKQKKIDVGKIWALHDAGWKLKEIALDADCSVSTVHNVLKRKRPVPEYEKETVEDD